MPKKSNNKPEREMTKRQLTHWQKESRIQRYIMLGGIIVVVAILAVLGTGLFMDKYKPYHQTVVKVGNTEYDMDYYINMLAYVGSMYGSPQYLPYMTDSVVQMIEQNKIYVQEAAKLGITVSDDEVKQEIQKQKLTSDPTRVDVVRARLVLQKMQKEYFDPKVLPSDEHRAVLAMFLESQGQVDEVKARLKAGEKFADIAAQLSLEKNSKDKKGDLGWLPKGVLPSILGDAQNKVLDDKVFAKDTTVNTLTSVQDADLSKSVAYWIVKMGEKEATSGKIHVYLMELGSAEQAKNVKAKLDAGEDFATLAKANSQASGAADNGGDIGFVAKGDLPAAVGDVIFPADASKALAQGKVTDPIKDTTQSTNGGFWLVEVTGIENKPIEGDNRTTLSSNLLQDWAGQVWKDNESTAESFLTEEQKSFAVAQAQSR